MFITRRLLLPVLFALLGCNGPAAQTPTTTNHPSDNSRIIGGPFENRELMYVGMPDSIGATDTSPGWTQNGQQLLITGTIFQQDGTTPAPNVVLYYYHTNINGLYAGKQGLNPKAVRHGYIRGWVKSGANGEYAIYTVRPASYPNSNIEAHIHLSIKEPGIDNEYYIDEFVFDDDPLLTAAKRKQLPNRGGSGILRPVKKGRLQIAEHHIILGLHIPDYPVKQEAGIQSGLEIGEDQQSFMPFHAFGPDKGSRACPVCKYGRYHGIIYFAGNNTHWEDIKKWLVFLEQLSIKRGKYLKAYFVYGNNNNYQAAKRQKELEAIGNELHLTQMALTWVPSFTDEKTEINLSRINPDAENTIIVYKNRTIINKYINIRPAEENFSQVAQFLEHTRGSYADME
jgi:protocatechuate 3,4-dioxygenase, beta subunit